MQSVMDGYFNNLGWEPWLLVCSALVMLWAGVQQLYSNPRDGYPVFTARN